MVPVSEREVQAQRSEWGGVAFMMLMPDAAEVSAYRALRARVDSESRCRRVGPALGVTFGGPMRPAILFFLLLGSACGDLGPAIPSQTAYTAQLMGYHGQPINTAIADLGPPEKVVEMAEGTKLYVFEHRGGFRTQRRSIAEHDREHDRVIVEHHGGDRIAFDCVTQLETDAKGLVVRHSFEGVACVAFPEAASPAPVAGTSGVAAPIATSADVVPASAGDPAEGTAGTSAEGIEAGGVASPELDTDEVVPEKKRKKKRLLGIGKPK
jgi:hypothetical protein